VLATTTRVRAGDYRWPADYHAALLSADAVREEDALSSFDVVFLRYNPLREPAGEPPSPVIDFCWRLRLSGVLVVNDPEGVRRAWAGCIWPTCRPRCERALWFRVHPRESRLFCASWTDRLCSSRWPTQIVRKSSSCAGAKREM